ncbi:EamA family transporter [Aneurinibacillus danicus]|uniref:Transporter n=1 Tax=Aneurinibacillus danicus TaxID=267746 RepID=A0A511V874_9BACL|nr:transporter [Aneurinibacillus danicus]
MKSISLAIVSIFIGSLGQILLKMGMTKVGGVSLNQLLSKIYVIFSTPFIIMGFVCFVSSSLLWMVVISQSQLSNTYPMVSLGYVFVFIMSIFLFNETVTFYKVLGLLVIIIGVILIGKG